MINSRILVLTGSSLHNLNTLATLLKGQHNIVGAVVANQKNNGINFKFLKIAIRKQGIWKVLFQIMERLLYTLLNRRRDKRVYHSLFHKDSINKVLEEFEENIMYTSSYDDPNVLSWMKDLNPDLIIIHTPYWVSKKVRDIVDGRVIGAHPGITQYYRGVHSSFWAIYKDEIDKIGYTIFWVDSGVDSGDIIYQEKFLPKPEDTYMSLNWRGMKYTAASLNKILTETDDIAQLPRIKNPNLTDNTIFYHPTIFQYIKYRIANKYR